LPPLSGAQMQSLPLGDLHVSGKGGPASVSKPVTKRLVTKSGATGNASHSKRPTTLEYKYQVC
jgi:hypothetical protein